MKKILRRVERPMNGEQQSGEPVHKHRWKIELLQLLKHTGNPGVSTSSDPPTIFFVVKLGHDREMSDRFGKK